MKKIKNKKAKTRQKRTVTKRVKTRQASRALVISQISLTPQQKQELATMTPPQFVKERAVRGGKKAKYVEGGYVVARLNQIFGQLNWQFEIMERGETARKLDKAAEGEVWVRGRLTIIDHAKGYKVFKDASGQHPIYPGVPYGDALKSAETDALKKAAARGLGIALDVSWNQLDTEEAGTVDKQPKVAEMTKKDSFELAKKYIQQENDRQILVQVIEKLNVSKLYTQDQKDELKKRIYAKLEKSKNA